MIAHAEHRVAIVAYKGISPLHLSVPCIVSGDDLARLGGPRYTLQVCAQKPGSIATLRGYSIDIRHDLATLKTAKTMFIPAWFDLNQRPSDALLDALRKAHARSAQMVGLCLDAIALAEAELLDRRVASIHWDSAENFAPTYPNVRVDRDVLYIDEGDMFASTGTAAAIDCCLLFVRCDHGADVANRIARRLLFAPHRNINDSRWRSVCWKPQSKAWKRSPRPPGLGRRSHCGGISPKPFRFLQERIESSPSADSR